MPENVAGVTRFSLSSIIGNGPPVDTDSDDENDVKSGLNGNGTVGELYDDDAATALTSTTNLSTSTVSKQKTEPSHSPKKPIG